MDATALILRQRPARPLLWVPALGLSLAGHGLLLGALHLIPAGALLDGGRSLPVETCVLAEPATFTLGPPHPVRARPREPGLFEIRVSDLPAYPSAGSPAAAQGPIVGEPKGRHTPGGQGEGVVGTPRGAGGKPAGPVIFEGAAAARSVVYVLDRSVSMGVSGALPAARRELLASLEQLPETTQFQIVLYNRHAEPLRLAGRSTLAPATPDCKRQAGRFLGPVRAEGGTDHVAALRQALALQPEALFLLTDAAELTAQQIQAVTRQNQGGTVIHTIELSGFRRTPAADRPLQLLARANRGTYRSVCLADLPE